MDLHEIMEELSLLYYRDIDSDEEEINFYQWYFHHCWKYYKECYCCLGVNKYVLQLWYYDSISYRRAYEESYDST